jgi:hypothetical protein
MARLLDRFDWRIAAPLLVTVILAFSGYYYTYQKDLSLANRKVQLERVDRQLRELYGPLYALSNAGTRTIKEFRRVYPSTKTEKEKAIWRLWMKEVFMPLNLEMEAVILKHSDLLVEPEMPEVLLNLSAHIAGYKAVLKSWDRGDTSRITSLIPFPSDLTEYAEKDYRLLKGKQTKLLGELDLRAKE